MTILVILSKTEYKEEDKFHAWAKELNMNLILAREELLLREILKKEITGIIISNNTIYLYKKLLLVNLSIPVVFIGNDINSRKLLPHRYWIWGRKDKNIRWALRYIYNNRFQNIFLNYGNDISEKIQVFLKNTKQESISSFIGVVFHGGFFQPMYTFDLTSETSYALSNIWNTTIFNIEYIPWTTKNISFQEIERKLSMLEKTLSCLNKPIIIYGHSAGSIPALILSKLLQKKSNSYISTLLVAPFYDIEDSCIVQDQEVYHYLKNIINDDYLDDLIKEQKKQNFHIIHGKKDKTISYQSSQKLMSSLSKKNNVKLHLIEDLSHMNITRYEFMDKNEIKSILQNFFYEANLKK